MDARDASRQRVEGGDFEGILPEEGEGTTEAPGGWGSCCDPISETQDGVQGGWGRSVA